MLHLNLIDKARLEYSKDNFGLLSTTFMYNTNMVFLDLLVVNPKYWLFGYHSDKSRAKSFGLGPLFLVEYQF